MEFGRYFNIHDFLDSPASFIYQSITVDFIVSIIIIITVEGDEIKNEGD
jgi:hypothetical protein